MSMYNSNVTKNKSIISKFHNVSFIDSVHPIMITIQGVDTPTLHSETVVTHPQDTVTQRVEYR